MIKNLKAGLIIAREGNRIYFTIEFDDEYAAMQAFDVWSMKDILFSYSGPKHTEEVDGVTDDT